MAKANAQQGAKKIFRFLPYFADLNKKNGRLKT